MRLKKLIKDLKYYVNVEFDHEVTHVTSYVEEVVYNSVFLCYDPKFVDRAIQLGAKTILCEEKLFHTNPVINYIYVDDIKKTKAILLKEFYNHIGTEFNIYGVIGTTGKSSTARMLADFLNNKNQKTLWIGTHEVIYQEEIFQTKNTTLDIGLFYQHLLLAKKRKYKHIVMEVSSIGIAELRTYGILFTGLIFTNFSEDHLDYHRTMDAYFYTKLIPFVQSKGFAVLNKDDKTFRLLNQYLEGKVYTYSTSKQADVMAQDITHVDNQLCFRCYQVPFKTKFYGTFFIHNFLAFIAAAEAIGFTKVDCREFLLDYMPLKGRMTVFKKGTNTIIVDYAHTPQSLESVLSFLKKNTPNSLYVVGGCGGNREEEKRKQMGEILHTYADYVILTDDNPRKEDPLKILKAMQGNYDYEIIENRKNAIYKAFTKLNQQDTLLIFGKGNEDSILYKDKTIEHNDIKYVEKLLI